MTTEVLWRRMSDLETSMGENKRENLRPEPARPTVPEDRVTSISQRISKVMVDETGEHPPVEEIVEVVQSSAASLAEAPVQEFVPLITEHKAREELRSEGLRMDLESHEPDTMPRREDVQEDEERGDVIAPTMRHP